MADDHNDLLRNQHEFHSLTKCQKVLLKFLHMAKKMMQFPENFSFPVKPLPLTEKTLNANWVVNPPMFAPILNSYLTLSESIPSTFDSIDKKYPVPGISYVKKMV